MRRRRHERRTLHIRHLRCRYRRKQPGHARIVDTAVANGSFKTLAAALQAANLIETLKGAGRFAVFAPTDEAFAKLPKGTVENLLKPENRATLTAILTYPVVPGNVRAADVVILVPIPDGVKRSASATASAWDAARAAPVPAAPRVSPAAPTPRPFASVGWFAAAACLALAVLAWSNRSAPLTPAEQYGQMLNQRNDLVATASDLVRISWSTTEDPDPGEGGPAVTLRSASLVLPTRPSSSQSPRPARTPR